MNNTTKPFSYTFISFIVYYNEIYYNERTGMGVSRSVTEYLNTTLTESRI